MKKLFTTTLIFLLINIADGGASLPPAALLTFKAVYRLQIAANKRKKYKNSGTGFVVQINGKKILATNVHIASSWLASILRKKNPPPILAVDAEGKELTVENLIGIDLMSDIAIFELPNYSGHALTLGSFDPSLNGQEEYYLVGYPGGSLGIIKAQFFNIVETNDFILKRLGGYQGPSTKGGSGAPIVNDAGEVVFIHKIDGYGRITTSQANKIENILQDRQNQALSDYDDIILYIQKKFDHLIALANRGDINAQYIAAYYYYQNDFTYGLFLTEGKADEYFKASARKGHKGSLGELGHKYYYGEVMEEVDYFKAIKYLEQAAEGEMEGDASAQFLLGKIYLEGIGAKRDLQKALQYLRLAARQGLFHAQYYMGLQYLYRRNMVGGQDLQKAEEYFSTALAGGFPSGAIQFGSHCT